MSSQRRSGRKTAGVVPPRFRQQKEPTDSQIKRKRTVKTTFEKPDYNPGMLRQSTCCLMVNLFQLYCDLGLFDPLPNVNADFKGKQASQRQQKQQNVKNVKCKESSKNETSKVSSKLKSKPVEYSSTKEHGNEELSPTISKTKNLTVNKGAVKEKELNTSSLQRGASKSSKLGEDRRNNIPREF